MTEDYYGGMYCVLQEGNFYTDGLVPCLAGTATCFLPRGNDLFSIILATR